MIETGNHGFGIGTYSGQYMHALASYTVIRFYFV